MTTRKKVARRKLSLLDLVVDMGNMSKACKIMGSSRQQFYETRRNYQTVGSERLFNRLPGPKEPHPNRVEEQVKTTILAYSLSHSTHGPLRVAQYLVLSGIHVSSDGIRVVWNRHNLLSHNERLLWLERTVQEQNLELSEVQVRLRELQPGIP